MAKIIAGMAVAKLLSEKETYDLAFDMYIENGCKCPFEDVEDWVHHYLGIRNRCVNPFCP